MKFYIASNLSNHEQVTELRKSLERAEHECSYDWTQHGSMQHDPEAWGLTADRELGGVIRADVVIVVLPGGRGTHAELGAALAIRRTELADRKKRIIVVGDDEQLKAGGGTSPDSGDGYNCVFHFHPYVERFESLAQLVEKSGLFV